MSNDHRAQLRALHHRPGHPLLLVNVWDAAGAAIVAACGAEAVGTTSAGTAWALGAADGGAVDRDQALEAITRIARAVDLPVTADIEGGYAGSPDEVGDTVQRLSAAGVAGINLEDGLRAPDEHTRWIAAVRDADPEMYVNARTDTYLRALGDPETRLADTVARARQYVAAGADGVFVPGLGDPDVIAELVAAVDVPVNILVGPGAPSVATLARLGVARISLGSVVAQAAYGLVQAAATALLHDGSYHQPSHEPVDYADLNRLVAPGAGAA